MRCQVCLVMCLYSLYSLLVFLLFEVCGLLTFRRHFRSSHITVHERSECRMSHVCVCVCVCACARVCVRACVRVFHYLFKASSQIAYSSCSAPCFRNVCLLVSNFSLMCSAWTNSRSSLLPIALYQYVVM